MTATTTFNGPVRTSRGMKRTMAHLQPGEQMLAALPTMWHEGRRGALVLTTFGRIVFTAAFGRTTVSIFVQDLFAVALQRPWARTKTITVTGPGVAVTFSTDWDSDDLRVFTETASDMILHARRGQ